MRKNGDFSNNTRALRLLRHQFTTNTAQWKIKKTQVGKLQTSRRQVGDVPDKSLTSYGKLKLRVCRVQVSDVTGNWCNAISALCDVSMIALVWLMYDSVVSDNEVMS